MTTINITETGIDCISTKITKEISSNLDTCVIEVPFDFSISIGDELNVYDKDSTLLFKGLVQNIKISGVKEVVAYDYGVQLMDININEIYTDEKAEDIIEDIVTNRTDLTYVSTIVTSTPITSYLIKDKKGWDVVNELAELLNATFRVDKNKNFYLELIEEDYSTESITTENAVIDDDWDSNAEQLVNKVTIIGDKQLFEKTETFDGTGAEDTFTLAEFPVDINIEVDGVEQTGYVEGATTIADYKVQKGTKNIVFESGSIPGSGTDNVVIRYTFSIDIKLVSQDKDSIDQYGGPNEIPKEKKIVKPYITSFQEARRFANFYLGIYAQPLLTSTWIINDYTKFESFIPNQLINIIDSLRNVNGSFIIKKVEREYPGRLKVDVGWREDDILDWNKEVQYRIKQLEEVDDNSTILQEYGFIQNNVQIQVSTQALSYERTLPDNYMYLGDENDSPVYANIGDGTERPLASNISDLLFWWKLDNTVIDEVNNEELTWAITGSSWTTGKQFDVAADITAHWLTYSTPISSLRSVSFWIYPENVTGSVAGLVLCDLFEIGMSISGSVVTVSQTGLTNANIYINGSLGTTMTEEEWYNVVVTFDNPGVNSTDYVFGGGNGGRLGDVRLYNKVISSDEINAIYNGGDGSVNNSDSYPKFYITNKNYWATPEYEYNIWGYYYSWGAVPFAIITTENVLTIETEDNEEITTQ